MRNWRRAGGVLVALTLLVASSVPGQGQGRAATNVEQVFAGALTEVPQGEPDVTGSFYIPAYSSVTMSQGKLRADFSVTLSIHNASETKPLVLKRVAYFDGNGIELKLNHHQSPCLIYLEPEVIEALKSFWARMQDKREAGK